MSAMLPKGRVVNGYRVLGPLGRGKFSVVYQAAKELLPGEAPHGAAAEAVGTPPEAAPRDDAGDAHGDDFDELLSGEPVSEGEQLLAAASLGAGRWQLVRHVALPAALSRRLG